MAMSWEIRKSGTKGTSRPASFSFACEEGAFPFLRAEAAPCSALVRRKFEIGPGLRNSTEEQFLAGPWADQ